MSRKHTNFRRSWSGRPLAVGVFTVATLVAVAIGVAVSGGSPSEPAARGLSPVSQNALASLQTFSPGETQEAGEGGGDGAADWTMHAYPLNDISLVAINASR